MKKTITTYVCDLCGEEFSEQIPSCPINVFEIPVDEYGRPYRDEGKLTTSQADLCMNCIDKITVLEMRRGICCPVDGEGKLRWRKSNGEDA